jgi:hypothetical protein
MKFKWNQEIAVVCTDFEISSVEPRLSNLEPNFELTAGFVREDGVVEEEDLCFCFLEIGFKICHLEEFLLAFRLLDVQWPNCWVVDFDDLFKGFIEWDGYFSINVKTKLIVINLSTKPIHKRLLIMRPKLIILSRYRITNTLCLKIQLCNELTYLFWLKKHCKRLLRVLLNQRWELVAIPSCKDLVIIRDYFDDF